MSTTLPSRSLNATISSSYLSNMLLGKESREICHLLNIMNGKRTQGRSTVDTQ